MAAKSSPHLRVATTVARYRQSSTIDNAQIGQQPRGANIRGDSTLSVLEVIRDEEIELEAIEELDLDQAAGLGKQENALPERDEEEEMLAQEEDMPLQLTSVTSAPLTGQAEVATGLQESRSMMVGSPPP